MAKAFEVAVDSVQTFMICFEFVEFSTLLCFRYRARKAVVAVFDVTSEFQSPCCQNCFDNLVLGDVAQAIVK